MFGNNSATGGSGGMFGNKPAGTTGGLFGNNNNASGGLFGNNANNNNNSSLGSSFGLGGQQQNGLQAQGQNNLNSQNPYGANTIFSNVPLVSSVLPSPSQPIAKPIGIAEKKKMTLVSAYKLSPKPLFSPKERFSGSTKAASPSSASPTPTSTPVSSADDDSASGARGSKVFNSAVDRNILSSSIFAPSRSITKLIIDKSKKDDSLDSLKNQDLLSPKKQVSFRFDVSKSDIGITSSPIKNGSSNVVDFLKDNEPEELPEIPSTDSRKEAKTVPEIAEEEIEIPSGFWTSPSFDEIRSMSAMELRAVKDFTVGQKGFGSIKFLEPVDLTSISLQRLQQAC
ncbi:unnamed protein product [[Candida] boidinii]|nr:unnamed protein product [[Candida] boidinii]